MPYGRTSIRTFKQPCKSYGIRSSVESIASPTIVGRPSTLVAAGRRIRNGTVIELSRFGVRRTRKDSQRRLTHDAILRYRQFARRISEVDAVLLVGLFKKGQNRCKQPPACSTLGTQRISIKVARVEMTVRKFAIGIMIVVQSKTNILDVVAARHSPRGFARSLHGWQEQPNLEFR